MRVYLVGFGSQGSAWGECLVSSGHEVVVALDRREGRSFEKARALGLAPILTAEISAALESEGPAETALVALLTPDAIIAPLYRDFLAPVRRPLALVLAHGYSVYARELVKLAPGHEAVLLAPKAIGPKITEAFRAAPDRRHALKAAFHAPAALEPAVRALAAGLGFRDENLIAATFDEEAVGDLISEQALLTGGVFNLLDWTFQAMKRAGVPDALIREECLTELELIAGLVRSHGPAETLGRISQAARCGTILMRRRLEAAGVPEAIARQAESVVRREFPAELRKPEWEEDARQLEARLASLEGVRI